MRANKASAKAVFVNLALIAAIMGTALPSGRLFAQFIENHRSHSSTGRFLEHFESKKYRLTLYGTSDCTYCDAARDFLSKKNISFNNEAIDKSSTSLKLYKTLSTTAVPALLSEDRLIVGFHPMEYEDLLNAATLTQATPSINQEMK